MTEKQVVLSKTEYDAMEQELIDLRSIVESRELVTIVEENLDWRVMWRTSKGTMIKYLIQDEQQAAKALADKVKSLQEELANAKSKMFTFGMELDKKSDEIARLKKQTWYEKLFEKKVKK